MVMRSIYWILACCLMFAAVMVMGVSMQSCKSKRAMEKSVHMDSVGMSAYKEEMDSFAFRRLLERYNKNFSLEIRHYRPVKDSAGKLTDTYLEQQVFLSHRNVHERDSSSLLELMLVKEDSTEVHLSEDTEIEESPVKRNYNMLFFVFIIVVFLCFWRKDDFSC